MLQFEGIYQEYIGRRLDLIAKFLPDNPVIFEAGGHYGWDTVKFCLKWPNAKIISFEANPHTYEKLLEKTNWLQNIQVYNLAVNNYNGTAILNACHREDKEDPSYEGTSSLLPPSELTKNYYQGSQIEVPCIVLDDWCEKNNIETLDFMWLDLEGLEQQVLQSSPRILESVKVIYTETNFIPFRMGTTQYKELRAFLEKSGFKLLAHWYVETSQGEAIFVKNEIFKELKHSS